MAGIDRLKGSFAALAGADPRAFYRGVFAATLEAQAPFPSLRVDIVPDDPRWPPLSNIPLKTGVPGVSVVLKLRDAAGQRIGGKIKVLVGWEDADPSKPFAHLWDVLPENVIDRLIVDVRGGGRIELGAPGLIPVQDGVVTGQGKDVYSGLPFWMLGSSSAVVGAKK
jgi:hypothetical protein